MKSLSIAILSVITLFACNGDKQSFTGNWIEVMPANLPFIQGVTLHADGSATSINMATLQYEKWKTEDKAIILWGKSIGNGQTINFADTLSVIKHTSDSLVLGKSAGYQITYTRTTNVDSLLSAPKEINPLDSLHLVPECGKMMQQTYQGTLPAASCPGIEYTLTLHKQEFNGNGVYKLILRYLEANNGKDELFTTYGKLYTLRGDATNPNATVYQLIPFDKGEPVNFLYSDSTLTLLNQQFEQAASKLNYTLQLQK